MLFFLRLPFASWQLGWVLAGLVALPLAGPAQTPPPSTDYLAALKPANLSRLWSAPQRVHPDKDFAKPFAMPDPIGFIGPDYQRFYLHYTSIQKDAANPYVYRVAGKTRVKTNICAFTGTITVLKARLYKAPNSDFPPFREGELTCRVELAEDRRQPSTGTIRGTLTTYFYLDKQGQPQYNLLGIYADLFSNNECTGTWTSYASGQAKTCNWGDFFIPNAGPLRFSDTEFQIAPKYRAHGWQTYQQVKAGGEAELATKKALAEENRHWWK